MSKKVSVFARDDGQTLPTRIKEESGRGEVSMHGEVTFHRRPSSNDFIAELYDQSKGKDDKKHLALMSRAMAAKIVAWDVCDDDGKPVPINTATVKALHPNVFRRMREIICYGTEAGDVIKESGVNSGEEGEEEFFARLQKNSQAASDSGSNTPTSPKSDAATVSATSTT